MKNSTFNPCQHSISPLPMQYLGSKSRISSWILDIIEEHFHKSKSFFDICAGTGIVSIEASKRGYEIYANDCEPFSKCILKSLLSSDKHEIDLIVKRLEELDNLDYLLSFGRETASELLYKETSFFELLNSKKFDWKAYQSFCNSTPLTKGTEVEVQKLKNTNEWSLFLNYYANTYFGIRQCLQLDALRQFAETLSPLKRNHVIASAISAMTYGVSSTTHLAQFLKTTSEDRVKFLIKRRQYDFLQAVKERLIRLKEFSLPKTSNNVFQMDGIEAIKKINNKASNMIIYVDPPYFKEHYSRYYHILNTFYLYDFPTLTYNTRIKGTTIGRYREARNISDFGKKSKVLQAFEKLFNYCKNKYYNLALSYAETSLVDKKDIIRIAKKTGLKEKIFETHLMHSAQGQPGNKKVKEYLFLFH